MLILRLAALVLASTASVAADDAVLRQHRERLKEKWEAQFRAADLDANRRLTREEIETSHLPDSLLSRFDEIDTDHDKSLSPEELWSMYEKRLEAQRRPSAPSP